MADGIVALWAGFGEDTNVPTNYELCDGEDGTEDLRNLYLKGAGTEEDAGATGGSTENVHDISHSHTATNHSHSGAPSAGRSGGSTSNGGGLIVNAVHQNHTHTVTMANTSIAPPAYSSSLTTTEVVEPAYFKLCAIQKKAGGIKERGIIGMWLGAVADIPKGWVLCDGSNDTEDLRNQYVKIANDTTEIGDTGGSNTHTHAEQSHSHGTTSHSHTGTAEAHVAGQNDNPDGSGVDVPTPAQTPTHSVQSVSTDNASWNSANTEADESNNEPPYRTVAYIQFQTPTDGGAFLENFM